MAGAEDQQTAAALESAVRRAEDAAAKAERVAKLPKYWLLVGLLFAVVGAVLALALKSEDPSALGVRLEPLGGVLFALGVLMMAAAALSSVTGGGGGGGGGGSGGGTDPTSLKSIGGLIAVVTAITAVTALTIVTLTQLGSNKDSIVAVTSSAFGIISAVVGAYLGIKITADTSAKSTEKAGQETKMAEQQAQVAEQQAQVANSTLQAVTSKIDEVVPPAQAAQVKAAGFEAGEAAAQSMDPPQGGNPP